VSPLRSPFITAAQLPDPFTLVIFGANGDLSARKLMPAIYALWHRRYLPRRFAVVGLGRSDKTDAGFREEVRHDVGTFRHDVSTENNDWNSLLGNVFYHRTDFTSSDSMQSLARRLQTLESQGELPGNRLAYLATDPEYFCRIIEALAGTEIIVREALPEAYEHLLFDALRGDATLFMRSDELEAAWQFITPILDTFREAPSPSFPNYAAGTWGPQEAESLAEGCQGGWRRP
jgi:glucose-6-phosphate 1-dehydrogenase